MILTRGKYEKRTPAAQKQISWLMIPLAFFLVEVFAFLYLQPAEGTPDYWPLAFGALWAVMLGGMLSLLPRRGSRVVFGILFGAVLVYATGQTGYYQLFSEMMWLSDFRYASEGADYWNVILGYPGSWFVWIGGLLALAAFLLWKYPGQLRRIPARLTGLGVSLAAMMLCVQLPWVVFKGDGDILYANSDYGRMQSAQAAYGNMFNAHRLYQICGTYQTLVKDIARNVLPSANAAEQEEARETIGDYFEEETQAAQAGNSMTGLLKDKNVILVLMESMDDWMIGEHTPTIAKLMAEGISFTNFYTPPYGGIRTFNTEFCINTGSYLSSQGGYAFNYVTNEYNQSLASLLRQEGYSAKTFHYNDPTFYSRGVFSEAMGYEEYVWYSDYLQAYSEKERRQLLYDDKLVFSEPGLRQEFFREGKTLNFLITRSAHLSYQYREVISDWALKQYPQYRGLTGHEETDSALVKARVVDDMFSSMLTALEEEGRLEDTVIIGITDHYTYGYKDEPELMKLSGVDHKLLLEKTPCFIWSADLQPREVTKTLNTSDFLPTILNLLGISTGHGYLGQDAFDDGYEGYAIFSDGSWINGDVAYDAGKKKTISLSGQPMTDTAGLEEKMSVLVTEYVAVNNLILESDYYGE